MFLCHANEDKPAARELYAKLKAEGMLPWLDEEDLLPGQKWRVEIPKAIQASDVVLACLSKNTIASNGFVKKELEFALDIADKLADDAIFIIPARLQKCEFPGRLGDLHAVDLYTATGEEQLMQALRSQAQALGETSSPLERVAVQTIEVLKTDTPTTPSNRGLRLDPSGDVWRDGCRIEVSIAATERKLLLYLYEHAGQLCSYQEIMKAVWGAETERNNVSELLSRLRKKIEVDPSKPRFLIARPGIGVVLKSDA